MGNYQLVRQSLPTRGFAFRLRHLDVLGAARRGTLETPRGVVETPAFMPVGTQGTVKGIEIEQLRATQAAMVLCNTYHLGLRPGAEVVQRLGGLHAFMGWEGPILTDSGGFQMFSLADRARVTEQGVRFRSHVDGSPFELSPEGAMRIQQALGSDIAMVLDHVVSLPAEPEAVRDACERTVRWAARCRALSVDGQAQFGIVQGGLDEELRRDCAARLSELDFDGYAIGGLSVGESTTAMHRVLEATCPVLPAQRPRYLMGVGRPIDLLEAVRRGVDLFDCVMPTRNGRNALAFTDRGVLRLRNACHREDRRPLEEDCPCPACRRSRGYLRHLFATGEMLGPVLLTLHNLTYYQRLMQRARAAIEADGFEAFYQERRAMWAADSESPDAHSPDSAGGK
jgi:queuine tRNA-ribosyltransferase